jgi:hypothetical protein
MMASQIDNRSFIYRLDDRNRISFVNQDWLDFAIENQAPELNREAVFDQPMADFIADWETFHLYELIFRRVRMTGAGVVLPFRCDSPDLRRFMQLSIQLAGSGELELTGRILSLESRPPVPLLDPEAPRSHEMLTLCSWCKRIKIDDDLFVEAEKAAASLGLFGPTPPRLTHGVCPECFDRIRCELGLSL